MFKRTDEAEWSRFSKALSGNKEREADEREDETTDGDGAAVEQPAATASSTQAGPSAPRNPQDVNVGVPRPSRTLAPDARDDVETVIGDRTFFDGTFRAEEPIRVRGTVQGEVESKRSVFIDEQAKVTAKVSGATVTVAGQVSGQIVCGGRVEIKPSGRVTGEITAGTLVMQEGAFFEGNLKMASRPEEAAAAE